MLLLFLIFLDNWSLVNPARLNFSLFNIAAIYWFQSVFLGTTEIKTYDRNKDKLETTITFERSLIMYKKFISSSEINKLDILKKISNSNGINLVNISSELKLPVKSIQKYIRSLNQDLSEINKNVVIKKNKSKLYYIDIEKTESSFYYPSLSYYYSLNSPIFQLIKYVIGRNLLVSELCDKLHISNSHLYRIIKQTNQILKKYKVHISINKRLLVLLKGEEINLRIFIFSFINQCIPSNVWIFPTLRKNEVLNNTKKLCMTINASSATRKKILNLIQTFSLRISKKKFLPLIDPQNEKLFTFYNFFSITIIQDLFPTFSNLYPRKSENEYLYMGILLQVLAPMLVGEDYVRQTNQEIFNTNQDSVLFFIRMLEEWRDRFIPTISNETFKEITRKALLLFNISTLLDISILNTLELEDIVFNSKDFEGVHKINAILKKYVEKHSNKEMGNIYFYENQLYYLAVHLYLETKMHYVPKIRIFINSRIDYRTIEFIKTKILTVFSDRSIEFIKVNPSKADLIITDKYAEVAVAKKNIILSNYLDLYEWNHLITSIKNLLISKML